MYAAIIGHRYVVEPVGLSMVVRYLFARNVDEVMILSQLWCSRVLLYLEQFVCLISWCSACPLKVVLVAGDAYCTFVCL